MVVTWGPESARGERETTGTIEDAQILHVCGNNFTVKPTVFPARFEVLTEVWSRISVFWVVTLCRWACLSWTFRRNVPPQPSEVLHGIIFLTCRAAAQCWPLLPHSWGLQMTHNDAPQSVGLLWTSDQPDTESSTWQHITLTREKKSYDPGGIRTEHLRRRATADVRPRGHWDRILDSLLFNIKEISSFEMSRTTRRHVSEILIIHSVVYYNQSQIWHHPTWRHII
jgi:hypothetical protein